MEWEKIDDFHRRARVAGGWLVKAYEDTFHPEMFDYPHRSGSGYDWRIAMCFVPDPEHTWII